MTNQQLLNALQNEQNVKECYQLLDTFIAADHERLISFFDLLPKDWNRLLHEFQLRSCYYHIINAVCINNDTAFIPVASALFHQIERQSDKLKIASMLSSMHQHEDLLDELVAIKEDDLLRLVIHEIVSRGMDLRQNKHYDYLQSVNHSGEFHALVLYPLEPEMVNTFPGYQRHENGGVSSSYGTSYGFAYEDEYRIIEADPIKKMECREDQEIPEAIDHWKDSCGMLIGYKGRTDRLVSIDALVKSIPAFSGAEKIRIKPLDTSTAFQKMFDASSKGVAYSNGNFAAYGRLKTWKSIHKMTGGQAFESNLITFDRMKTFHWVEFNTDAWFINEVFDLGIIGYHPDTFEFGFIVGTDTD